MMEAASEINKRSSAALSVFSKMGMRRRMKARQADARAKGVPAREYTQYLGPWSLTRTSHRRLAKLQVRLLRITRRGLGVCDFARTRPPCCMLFGQEVH